MMNYIGQIKRTRKSAALFVAVLLAAAGMIFIPVSSLFAASTALDKLDSALKPLVDHTQASNAPMSVIVPPPVSNDGTVRVYVRLKTDDPAAVALLAAKGLQVTARYGGLVSGTIRASQLLNLAALDMVSTIHPFRKPIRRSVTGEGVEALRANLVHEGTPAFTGAGVKVGILSDSFGLVSNATPVVADVDNDGIMEIMGTDSQLSGDLPATVKLIADASPEDIGSVNDEGRAMAEIIHEMAPGAVLYFRTAWHGVPDFAEGILELAKAGCRVIVDDIGYFEDPLYQDGEIAQAITEAAQKYNAVYLSAAGNDGSQSVEGTYHDIDPDINEGPWVKIPQGYDLHVWNSAMDSANPFLAVRLPVQATVDLMLYWENAYSGTLGSGATTDYDLYVFSEPTFSMDKLIGVSDTSQGSPEYPMGDPQEILEVTNYSDTDSMTIYIAMNKHHGPDVPFKLLLATNGVTLSIQSDIRSRDGYMIFGHPNADEALALAAVNVNEVLTDGAALDNPRRIDPVYYTSHGGQIPILFSPTGTQNEKTVYRVKPDIASVDGAVNSFFGSTSDSSSDSYPRFFGTSAAAPHAAGIVVLMLEANPTLSAADVRRLAREAATDIGETGVDVFTGYGLLYADTAVKAASNPSGPITPVRGWEIH